MERALIIGRFQPIHNGHMEIIRLAAEKYKLIIAIGSPLKSHSVNNPFTGGERYEMMRRALDSEGIKAEIIPISDIEYNSVWASHVMSLCPPFDVVLSNNPLTIELFSPHKRVIETGMFSRKEYSGREIRRRMMEGDDWDDLVPQAVSEYIRKIGGEERITYLSRSDEHI